MSASSRGEPAPVGPRFLARLIDYVFLGMVTGVLGGTFGLAAVDLSLGMGGWGEGRGTAWEVSAATTLVSTSITLAYFVLLEWRTGLTLGKILLDLETRGPGGGRPTAAQALRRNAFTAIPVIGIVPALGWIAGVLVLAAVITIAVTINSAATRQGWHDVFAGGTTVVRTG